MTRRVIEVFRQGRVGADGLSNLVGVEMVGVDTSVLNADSGKVYRCTAALTLTLPSATSDGWSLMIDAVGGDVVMSSPMTINGLASVILEQGSSAQLYSDGTSIYALYFFNDPAGGTSGVTGQISWFGMETPPAGWAAGVGADVSRAAYPELFARFGTLHGAGDGSTTFGTPLLIGRHIEGSGAGNAVGAFLSATIEEHVHGPGDLSGGTSSVSNHNHNNGSGSAINHTLAGGPTVVTTGYQRDSTGQAGGHSHSVTITGGATGAYGGVKTRPDSLFLLGCYKY